METAIIVIWTIALLGALGLTVIVLAEVVRVVHHAREIDRVVKVALPAAGGRSFWWRGTAWRLPTFDDAEGGGLEQ